MTIEDSTSCLVWFRFDLRLADNAALKAALSSGDLVRAVYVYDENASPGWSPGGASRWYLHHSLSSLQRSLASLGVELELLHGDATSLIPRLARDSGCANVCWNFVAVPGQQIVDRKIQTQLLEEGLSVEVFPDDTLLSPSSITKSDGSLYRVFTPFWKRARELLLAGGPQGRLLEPPQPVSDPVDYDSNAVTQLGLLDSIPWHEKLHDHWQPGELAANQRMEQFFASIVADYSSSRDIPAVDGTSQLSAALHFGEISAMRVFSRSQEELLLQPARDMNDSLLRFQAELGWREFSRYVLMANPTSTDRSLDERFESDAAWEKGTDHLERWQQAQTGVPLIDAGMRQLWETGWMHNRVRMVCASFLTKNLGVHWLEGARWFWDTLVDADLASNTLGWQWVAGCGTDAAPYYRIFNPVVQEKKFDPDGAYVSHWLGDHDKVLPIVDLKISRARALERYEAIRNSG